MKKILILIVSLLSLTISGCTSNEEVNIIDDNTRNIYEIFVASFYDSDGDKVGDLNGVSEKLDYIADMGYTGIWMMPIHKSSSYHKYDVIDYYSIDKSYGTLEDFDNLVAEAHKRNIHIILDLVVNHTSSSHPYFQEAKARFMQGGDSKYISWYNFNETGGQGYTKLADNKYYESRFVDTMPDLNLDNEEVREEIVNIMKFWLDRGVDGFRLDAVTSYYTDSVEKNTEFLAWLNDEAKKIKEDCYLVGEAWTSDNEIGKYYESDVDSFFQFSLAQGEGKIAKCLNITSPVSYYKSILNDSIKLANGHIPAVFLDNHDMNRITGGIGRSALDKLKFAYGLVSMLNGTVYTYYGTEIGMVGSGKDENKRIAMLWGEDEELCKNPAGTTKAEYVYPGVKEQEEDESSLLNYHKSINIIRNKYPEIARGEVTFIDECSTSKQLVMEKTWHDTSIIIVINFDETENASIDLSDYKYKKCESISVSEKETIYKNGILDIPGYTISILYN